MINLMERAPIKRYVIIFIAYITVTFLLAVYKTVRAGVNPGSFIDPNTFVDAFGYTGLIAAGLSLFIDQLKKVQILTVAIVFTYWIFGYMNITDVIIFITGTDAIRVGIIMIFLVGIVSANVSWGVGILNRFLQNRFIRLRSHLPDWETCVMLGFSFILLIITKQDGWFPWINQYILRNPGISPVSPIPPFPIFLDLYILIILIVYLWGFFESPENPTQTIPPVQTPPTPTLSPHTSNI